MIKPTPFDIRRRGFTADESRHIGAPANCPAIIPAWLPALLVAAAAVIVLHLFFAPTIEVAEAHAETPMKTNADYCQEWQRGIWNVVGASEAEMISLCAKYRAN